MNTLTDARAELVDLLTEAGLTAVPFLPERPQPPLAIVTPGHPYLIRGEQFGQHKIGLTVMLLTATANNEQATKGLDAMIATMATAVFAADGWRLGQVDPPQQIQVGTAGYLGCVADVTCTAVLEVS